MHPFEFSSQECTMSQSPMGQLGLQTVEYQRKRKAVEFIMPNFVPCDQHLCHMHDLRVALQQRNCAAERLQKFQEVTLVMIMIAIG
jgi:hypothetical protein